MKITKHAPSMMFVARILVATPVAWVTLRAQQQAPALSALDYAEIGQLVNRYAHAIDTCSNSGYGSRSGIPNHANPSRILSDNVKSEVYNDAE